jgi:hypothetical protein
MHPISYQTFLLTVWQEPNPAVEMAECWRFRLEDPRTNQQGLMVALKEEAVDNATLVR